MALRSVVWVETEEPGSLSCSTLSFFLSTMSLALNMSYVVCRLSHVVCRMSYVVRCDQVSSNTIRMCTSVRERLRTVFARLCFVCVCFVSVCVCA